MVNGACKPDGPPSRMQFRILNREIVGCEQEASGVRTWSQRGADSRPGRCGHGSRGADREPVGCGQGVSGMRTGSQGGADRDSGGRGQEAS